MSEVRIGGGQSDDKERTDRGFRIFGCIESSCQKRATVSVQESSIAFEGAHVWLQIEGECVDHLGNHLHPCPHLNVDGAKALIVALQEFIDEAEANNLMEPARCDDNEVGP